MRPLFAAACAAFLSAVACGADPGEVSQFRIRPYLQNPAPNGMTVRWLSASAAPGVLTCDGRTFSSSPVLGREFDYLPNELADSQDATLPFLHSVRVTGLEPATSYPYAVEQDGETIHAVLTTAPRPGEVGRGGGVRLFFYSDCETQPESRGSRSEWLPSVSLPGGPRPRWVGGRYPVDETTGYRMNLALMAARAAESLRAGNPVLTSIVGDLVESGGEQRDWDEFWRHNAGPLGSLASRVPVVAALGDHDILSGPKSADPAADMGGYAGPLTLRAAQKFLTYFEHPANGAEDERHQGRYHRVDFGPVTLLTLDSTNGGTDDGDTDTNHELDRENASHVPDYAPGSAQHEWLKRELAAARDRGAITFVQFHHAPFSSGIHGQPPGKDEHSGQPLRPLADLFHEYGVRAVFSGHDEMYEHSSVDGVHYYDVGIGGDGLPGPAPGVVNERQIFLAHDHAPERWKGNVLESGGKHYGHVEVDVVRSKSGHGFTVTITPVHVFPVLDPDAAGEIADWERRTYDDVVSFEAVGSLSAAGAAEKEGL